MAWYNFRQNRVRDKFLYFINNCPDKIEVKKWKCCDNTYCVCRNPGRVTAVVFNVTAYDSVNILLNSDTLTQRGMSWVYKFWTPHYPLNSWMAGFYLNEDNVALLRSYVEERAMNKKNR